MASTEISRQRAEAWTAYDEALAIAENTYEKESSKVVAEERAATDWIREERAAGMCQARRNQSQSILRARLARDTVFLALQEKEA